MVFHQTEVTWCPMFRGRIVAGVHGHVHAHIDGHGGGAAHGPRGEAGAGHGACPAKVVHGVVVGKAGVVARVTLLLTRPEMTGSGREVRVVVGG